MNTQASKVLRPEYISPMWLKHAIGFSFSSPPPEDMALDRYLASPNLWERILCVTLQAQQGDFRNVRVLIDVANLTTDPDVGVAAVKVFAHASPSSILYRLTSVFDHRDYDIRIESYTAPLLACDLSLVTPLLELFPTKSGDERAYIADTLWDLLEADFLGEEAQLTDLDEDDPLIPVARRMASDIRQRYGPQTAILHGVPLSLGNLISTIHELSGREDSGEMGGVIDDLLSIFEAMTGVSRVGCLTSDCTPVRDQITSTLDAFEESGGAERFEIGRRYFFGHPIPGHI